MTAGNSRSVCRRSYLRTTTALAASGIAGLAGCQELDSDEAADETGSDTASTDGDDDRRDRDSQNETDEVDDSAGRGDTDNGDPPDDGADDTNETVDRLGPMQAVGHVSPEGTIDEIELTVILVAGADEV